MTPDVPGGSPSPLDRLLAYLAKDAEGFRAIGNDFQAEEIEVWRDLVSQSATQLLAVTKERDEARLMSAPNAAAICAALKTECDAQHARAEQLAASVQTLQQENKSLRTGEGLRRDLELQADYERVVAERSALRQTLHALVEKWREAERPNRATVIWASDCANDLDAALAVGRSQESAHHD